MLEQKGWVEKMKHEYRLMCGKKKNGKKCLNSTFFIKINTLDNEIKIICTKCGKKRNLPDNIKVIRSDTICHK